MSKIFDLSSLTADQGFTIKGAAAGDFAGASVSIAGDVNGDGFADMVVGAFGNDDGGSSAGKAFVVFGKKNGFADVDLASLASTDGFSIQGDKAQDFAGVSVSSAGDINGDGFDDMLIGALFNDDGGENAGKAYVVFGKANGFDNIDLSSLTSSAGFSIQGDTGNDRVGSSVSSAGDINGDGFDDMIVGAPIGSDGGTFAGEAYVLFGKESGFANIDLASLNASDGFIIQGDEADDRAGTSVSSAGDINGDGFDDMIVGAPNGGKAHVLFGKASDFANIDLTTLNVNDGFTVSGLGQGASLGTSVSSAGDINGDGLADIAIGARFAGFKDSTAGAVHVLFGKARGFEDVDLSSLSKRDGFTIKGVADNDLTGASVSAAGDVNGDGFDDIILGVPQADDAGSNSGNAYVIFGKADGFKNVKLSSLAQSDGFVIRGATAGDNAGEAVSGSGDINGDGIDDIVVGAGGNDDGGSSAGAAHVIFGARPDEAVNRTGSDIGQSIFGGDFDDTLSGLGGKDRLDGAGGADVLNGGKGADTLLGGKGNDRLNGGKSADVMEGGKGSDTYIVDNRNDSIAEASNAGRDLVKSSVTFSLGNNLENLTLTGKSDIDGAGNKFGNLLTGNSGANSLDGGAGDDRLNGGLGLDILAGGKGEDVFVFDVKLTRNNVDTITDFNHAKDTFELDHAIFKGLDTGPLSKGAFTLISAADSNWGVESGDRILYDEKHGDLYFDRDGSGGEYDRILFAHVEEDAKLDHTDFHII